MKVKRLIVGAAVSSLAVVSAIALIANGATEKPKKAAIATPTCASIHFGMNDNTLGGYIATYGTNYTEGNSPFASLGYASGITVESVAVSGANAQWLDNGTKYKISGTTYTSDKVHGLKLGSGSNNTTLTYSFTEKVIACDIYAIGWNDASIKISVNGSDKVSVPKNSSVSGNFDDKSITYTKYHFDLDESSDTLEIATEKRLFIGDIALRLA